MEPSGKHGKSSGSSNPEDQFATGNLDEVDQFLTYAALRHLANDQLAEIKRLRHSQQDMMTQVRNFITSFPFGLIILNKKQTIEAINDMASEYFQYPSSKLVKKPISILFPEVKTVELATQARRLMGRKQSGETFAVEVFVNVLERDGQDMLFVSVQDITERFRLEQMRQDLTAMVSHDLRAPLTSIRVSIEMVKNGVYGKLSERGDNVLDKAIMSAEYLSNLVVSWLDAEKADSGSIELEFAETSIGQIVNKALSTMQRPDQKMDMIEVEFTNDSITVDRDRIVQVIINLLSNAMKYSPEGAKVRLVAGMEGMSAKFQIIDQGTGIPLDQRSLIFERYRQLKQSADTKSQGFGLGLAICKSIVEKHGGRIWVEDGKGGKGSNFCFTVPITPE
jgi:PAS domain S-box